MTTDQTNEGPRTDASAEPKETAPDREDAQDAASRDTGPLPPMPIGWKRSREGAPTPVTIPGAGASGGLLIAGGEGDRRTDETLRNVLRALVAHKDGAGRHTAVLLPYADERLANAAWEAALEAGRQQDVRKLRLGGHVTWNPLDVPWTDERTLAALLIGIEDETGDRQRWSRLRASAIRLLEKVLYARRRQNSSGWVTLKDVHETLTDSGGIRKAFQSAYDHVWGRYRYRTLVSPETWVRWQDELQAITVTRDDLRRSQDDQAPNALFQGTLGGDQSPKTYRYQWREEKDGHWTVETEAWGYVVLNWWLTRHSLRDPEYQGKDAVWGSEPLNEPDESDREGLHAAEDWAGREWNAVPEEDQEHICSTLGAWCGLFAEPEARRLTCPGRPGSMGARQDAEHLGNAAEQIVAGRIVILERSGNDPLDRSLAMLAKHGWASALRQRPELDLPETRSRRPVAVVLDRYEEMTGPEPELRRSDRRSWSQGPDDRMVPIVVTRDVGRLAEQLGGREAAVNTLNGLRSVLLLRNGSDRDAATLESLLWTAGTRKPSPVAETINASGPQSAIAQIFDGRTTRAAQWIEAADSTD